MANLIIPKSGTERASSVAKTPIQKLVHNENKGNYGRTTICIDPVLFKEFKVYAAQHDTSVSALLNKAIKQILGKK
ncbi:MAG: hypothetical protein MJY61_04470 [Bacteroidales bacterium]|nr:hypothetical protein [Bacteroidales bacterium]